MKTEISDFCKHYAQALIPAGEVLDVVVQSIRNDSQEDVLRVSLAGFSDIKHRLKSLIDKVAGQQAYLLIFGPLKSGKSTLMNAISGSYVSEVTSLPAYPCLVYVTSGESQSIRLTRYNGRETATEDKEVMEVLIKDSHANLADRIRKVEEQGREFDPHMDYPEAIRRIDINVRAAKLDDSGTVLVDTPGLYSRMKFGYDLMTREFRNSATSAVFVVKTDNLFFEDVFREFEDLLGFFSRVFLVVNYDSSKRDLRPDGSFEPSVESRNPQEVISKFETLTMSAALRKAADQGRLKIYPIDLLNAASRRLRDAEGGEPASEGTVSAAVPASSAGDVVPPVPGKDGEVAEPRPGPTNDFDAFLDDLTEYLNSSDYLFELMVDSFQQGDVLRKEMLHHGSEESMSEFVSQKNRLASEMQETEEQLEAAANLVNFNWNKAFDSVRDAIRKELGSYAEAVRQDLGRKMLSSIGNWFESDESLENLVANSWQKGLDDLQKGAGNRIAQTVRSQLDNSSGGVQTIPDLVIAMDRLRLGLRDAFEKSADVIRSRPRVRDCKIALSGEDLPITRTFWDKLLFRSQSKIRRKLLGSGNYSLQVPPHKKRKRLLPAGREAMEKKVNDHLDGLLPGLVVRSADQFLQNYVRKFSGIFTQMIEQKRVEIEQRRQQLSTRIEANERISETFASLRRSIESLEQDMDALRQKFLLPIRLARGFQVLDTPVGPFTLWTLPYSHGGVLPLPPPASEPEASEEAAPQAEPPEGSTDDGDVVPGESAPEEPDAGEAPAESVAVEVPENEEEGMSEAREETGEAPSAEESPAPPRESGEENRPVPIRIDPRG